MNYKQEADRAARLEQLVKMLAEQELTRCQISEMTGWSHATVGQYLGWLRDRKRIYVSSWEAGKFVYAPRYSAGQFPDVPKPSREKPETKCDEKWARPPVVVNVHRMPIVAALFGEYRRAA